MHGEEVAEQGGLSGADVVVLLEVLHVQSDGDCGAAIGLARRGGHLIDPDSSVRPVWWDDANGVLVAQIPRPERRVPGKRVRGLTRQQDLRSRHFQGR